MTTLHSPLENVREIEHTWIPTRDGTRLAARIWLPETAQAQPVPAVVEYIPYRKRDLTRARDAKMHPYFAANGYASVRVDLRGSGDSEGVLTDEYLPLELEDGEDVLRWLAAQPWCNGATGIIGISWGGFNGLQIAARQPPELKAVISVCSTDNRYTDDVHYMGGCMLSDNLSWASNMFAYNSMPPDPELVGERWRDMWFQRLEGSGLWLETWMRHPHRDEYWKHGSICEDFTAVRCPVMAVSGWADGYSNAVFRLLAGLDVPRRGIIGPWSHLYPHLARQGPAAIGFLQECVRWWDQWLKGIETGVGREPALAVWMQDSIEPSTIYTVRPGRWIAEDAWPSPNIVRRVYEMEQGRILPEGEASPERTPELRVQSPLSVGLFAGKWCSYAAGPDLPHDQREEDGGSLIFDSDPLEQPLEILGAVEVELELKSNRPVAMVAIRLSDVAPDGKATRVTYGLLNLCHRRSHERPEPMTPDRAERVTVSLNEVAQRFPRGHRIRLAISTSYWPLAWPPPEPVQLTINPCNSQLILPVRSAGGDGEVDMADIERTDAAPRIDRTVIEAPHHNWLIHRDLATDESTLEVIHDHGIYRLDEIDLTIERDNHEWFRSRGEDFTSVCGEVRQVRALRRTNWDVRTVTRTILTCTERDFHINATLDAFEWNRRVFAETWNTTIPRQLV